MTYFRRDEKEGGDQEGGDQEGGDQPGASGIRFGGGSSLRRDQRSYGALAAIA